MTVILQCGKLERLEMFTGTKRSCRHGLQKRRNNHAAATARQQQQQRNSAGSNAAQPQSPCAASCSDCSSASLTEVPAGSLTAACYSSDTAAAAAAAPAAVPAVTQQLSVPISNGVTVEAMLWQELHKELEVPASMTAAAAAGLAPHPAAGQQQQQLMLQHCASHVSVPAAAAAAPAAVGFDYSTVDFTNEESLNQLEQMIEFEIMQALLQPQIAAMPAAAAAAQVLRMQRSAALLEQFQAVSAELQQLQAAVAELQGMQQQQQPGASLASSWEVWGA
jgi:hypothetical protein